MCGGSRWTDGRATGAVYFDGAGARCGSGRERWCVRQRVGDAAAAADVEVEPVSGRAGELERAGGQHLMFDSGAFCGGVFEHPLNDYKSVHVSRVLHDYYDTDPKRGFYGGGGIDARFDWYPIMYCGCTGCRRTRRAGVRVQARVAGQLHPIGVLLSHSTTLPVEIEQHLARSELKDEWGLPAMRVTSESPGRREDDAVPVGPPDGDSRSRGGRRRSGPTRWRRSRRASTCWGRAGWGTIRGGRWWTDSIGPMRCGICSWWTGAAS